ncbi:MAG: ribose-phosphate pyrophosphokinase-like domain-containing protein [Patescibacteria group bacterium]
MKELIKDQVLFFSGNGNHQLGVKILVSLGEFIGADLYFRHINFARFGDAEQDDKIPKYEEVAGKTIVLYQSMYTAELQEEFLQLCWALKHQYQAQHIIAVVPFLRFRRQDHHEKNEEINRLRMLIDRLAHAGVNQLVVATPHSVENMETNCRDFGIGFFPIDMSENFARTIKPFLAAAGITETAADKVIIYAPDEGSIYRAIMLARLLGRGVAFNLKKRGLNNAAEIIQAEKEEILRLTERCKKTFNFPDLYYATPENIRGKVILMIEDEIASGETANKTGHLLKSFGAQTIFFAATHAVCTPGWQRKLFFDNPFEKTFIADSIPRSYENRTGGLMHDVTVSETIAAELFQILRRHFHKN